MINRLGHAKLWAAALPLATLCHLTSPAHAQARSVYLYNASVGTAQASINDAKSGPWGNGEARNDRQMDYEGAPVLRVTTRNLQEGVRFDLKNPVDLDTFRESGFLRLRVKFRSMGGFGGGMGMPGMGGPMGGGSGMGMPGMMQPGMGGGMMPMPMPPMGGFNAIPGTRMGSTQLKPEWSSVAQIPGGALPPFGGRPMPMPGMGGAMGGGMGGPMGGAMMPGGMMPDGMSPDGTFGGGMMMPPPQTTQITQFTVTFIRENGATTGAIPVDLKANVADETGWRLLTLPLKNLSSTPNAAGPVSRIVLTSDQEDSFFLAQAALVVENGQMTVSIRRPSDEAGAQVAEIQVKPGPVTLIADVEAGASDPIVEWNFDADNVGNLPPGALSNPMGTMGMGDGMGMDGMGMQPGMMQPGMMQPGMVPGRPSNAPGMMQPGMVPGRPSNAPGMMQPGMMQPGMMQPGMGAPGMGGMAQVGPRLDARGLSATFEYPNEEQNYRVEVTVRDRSGKKEPVTASILVQVRG